MHADRLRQQVAKRHGQREQRQARRIAAFYPPDEAGPRKRQHGTTEAIAQQRQADDQVSKVVPLDDGEQAGEQDFVRQGSR